MWNMKCVIIPGNNQTHRISSKIVYPTRKTFNRFTTKDSYTRNITHNKEITAV